MAKRKVVLSTEPGTTSAKTKVAKRRVRKKANESLPDDSTSSVQEKPKQSVMDIVGSLDEPEETEPKKEHVKVPRTRKSRKKESVATLEEMEAAEKKGPDTVSQTLEAASGVARGPGEYAGIAWINSRFVKNVSGKPPELLREEIKHELLGIHKFETVPAMVTRGYDFRRNLGNFTTAQVVVHVQIPCYVEDLDHCDEYAQQWCESRMVREHNEMNAVAPGNGARPEPPPEF